MTRVIHRASNAQGGNLTDRMQRIAVTMGMVSIVAATVFWDTQAGFLEEAAQRGIREPVELLTSLWETASEESDTLISSLARIAAVASRYKTPGHRPKNQRPLSWASTPRELPQPGKRSRPTLIVPPREQSAKPMRLD